MARRWGTTRTEAFSDGVFAIAITLLVLDLNIPQSGYEHLLSSILHEWPAYLAYATSFMTIGGVWLAHHGLFARLQYVDQRLMRLNLLLLMVVAFLPFPTRLVASAIRDEGAERVAVLFYPGALFTTAVLIAVMWRVVAAKRGLLAAGTTDAEVETIVRLTTPNPAVYVTFMVVAILTPRAAAFGYFLASLALVLRARGEEHERPEPAT